MMNDFSALISDEAAALSLRSVLRPAPHLSPEDSLGRFLQTARHWPVTELPIMEDGKLIGVVSQESAIATLAEPFPPSRDALLQRPLRDFLQEPAAVARPDMTTLEIGLLCAAQGLPQIPVVDEAGFCHGLILYSDLLLPERPRPKPAIIGGMATPFGVYLTDGTRQAGAGNLALMATGALMALLFAATTLLVTGGLDYIKFHHWLPAAWFAETPQGSITPLPNALAAAAAYAVVFFLFVFMMRLTALAGYHAAEHQTVHAIERDEPLIPDVVCRMPRPHPRCGTNLMAAGFVFVTLMTIGMAIPGLGDEAYLPAALITLFTWRRVGTFLQAYFTTRPASLKQLQSGIAAGEELLTRYYQSPPSRVRMAQRVWSMGIVQVFIGMSAVSLPLYWLLDKFLPKWF